MSKVGDDIPLGYMTREAISQALVDVKRPAKVGRIRFALLRGGSSPYITEDELRALNVATHGNFRAVVIAAETVSGEVE